MSAGRTTHVSLILRLRFSDDFAAWAQFEEIYKPLVVNYSRKKGLQDADAADVWQEVLMAVRSFEYDRSRSFRSWLYKVTASKICDVYRRAAREIPGTGRSSVLQLLEQQPASEQEDFDREYFQNLLQWAAAKVEGEFEPITFRAFWSSAVENRATRNVALELGITENAVRIAKHRVLARVKQHLEQVE